MLYLGPNASYYRNTDNLRVVGLDPNPEMESYAISNAKQFGLGNFSYQKGYAEDMPADNDTFDAAICTLVCCLRETLCQRVFTRDVPSYLTTSLP